MITVDGAKVLLGVKTDKELAERLSYHQCSVTRWRKKGCLSDDAEEYFKVALEIKEGREKNSRKEQEMKSRMTVEQAKKLLGLKTDLALAQTIGRHQSAVCDWRRRGHLGVDAEKTVRKLLEGEVIHTVNHELPKTSDLGLVEEKPQGNYVFGIAAVELVSSLMQNMNDKERLKILKFAIDLSEE